MNERKFGIFLVVTIAISLMASVVLAVDMGQSTVGAGVNGPNETRGNVTAIGSDLVSGGNVSEMNLSTEALTAKWQGYFGNVSVIRLRLGSGATGGHNGPTNPEDNLFVWAGLGATKTNTLGVYATTGFGFDFSAIAAATTANYDTALEFATSDADTVANTMTGTGTVISASLGTSVPVASLNSYHMESGSWDVVTSKFKVGIFTDNSGSTKTDDYAVGVNVSHGPNREYANTTDISYELIVPVNGTAGAAVGQTYYFFVALK